MLETKILVVEDEALVAEDIRRTLKNMGYNVPSTASSGEEAIKKVEEINPDLVLMDIVLHGGMDGIEIAGQITSRFHTPVIYLTAFSDKTTLERAKITDPFGYIIKPFRERDLQINIEIALYKHKTETELKESKLWFSTTLKSIGDAVIAVDLKGCVVFMNPVARLLTGWDLKDAMGKPLNEVYNAVNEETGEQIESPIMNAMREGINFNQDSRIILIDKYGTKVPLEDRCDPIKDDKGNIIGSVLVFRDITERRQAEEEIQRRTQIQIFLNKLLQISLQNISLDETLEQVIDHITSISWLALKSMGGIWMVEDDPKVLVMKAQRRLPISLQTTCARIPFGRCICGRAAASGEIKFADHVDEHHEVRYQDIFPHGHYCIPLVSAGKVLGIINLFLKEGHSRNLREEEFLHVIADVLVGIVQRKQAEEALKRSYEFSMTILNSMNDAISIINVHDFRIVRVNSVFSRELGLKEEEVIGKTCYEVTHRRSEPCKPPADVCPLLETVKTGKHSLVEHVHYGKDGKMIFVEVSTSPIRDDKGRIIQVVHVSRDITERKRAEDKLKQANIELIKSDKLKTQFLSIVSHELRTPITPMNAQLQMIQAGFFGEITEKQKMSLDMILRNTRRLDRLIGDVLDISKLESGVMKFNMSKASLNEIVENAVETMEIQATEKNQKLKLKEDKVPEVTADKDRITQVIVNLINNAIKFTDRGGTIEVELSGDTDHARVAVRDSGIGIKKEDQEKLFMPFQQVDSSESRKYEGTGLGLAICKKIITYHGGSISVESEPGKGSTFYFTIPYNYKIKDEKVDSSLFEKIMLNEA